MQVKPASNISTGISVNSVATIPRSLISNSARQHQGKLWSNLNDVCELLQLPLIHAESDSEVQFQHVQFKTGQRVYTIGQPFENLYLVHSGFLKTVLIDESGNEQVLSFPMRTDLLGVDGIHSHQYASEAVALSN
ncbi:MAG: cyclic nucleotide-binding domain-containing protein, partial [Herbaspirillum sp.]